jgi:hypothetical protein
MSKTQYLYTKHKSGKIGITAHLSYVCSGGIEGYGLRVRGLLSCGYARNMGVYC